MRIIYVLLLIFFQYSQIVFCYATPTTRRQVDPISHNRINLQPPRDTVHLHRLPFHTICVLNGRMDTTDAVGVYKTGKWSGFRFTIPLRLDTTLSVAVGRYLNRWYATPGNLNDTTGLFVYVRKYALFGGKVALSADVYVEKDGSYYPLFREDTLFRRHWKYYISGGALDFLMERVRVQWRKMDGRLGSEVSLKEIEERQEGLAWKHFPIVHTDSTINGVYPSIHDFLQARPRAVSGTVTTITGRAYSWKAHLPNYLLNWIPQGDTIYTITFPKESLRRYRWLRRWRRQRYAIASQNGVLYLRFQKRGFLKLGKVGNTFVANASPQMVWAFLQPEVPEGAIAVGSTGPDTSYRTQYAYTSLNATVGDAVFQSIHKAIYEGQGNQAITFAYYSCNFDHNGWHFYIDMDLGVVICY